MPLRCLGILHVFIMKPSKLHAMPYLEIIILVSKNIPNISDKLSLKKLRPFCLALVLCATFSQQKSAASCFSYSSLIPRFHSFDFLMKSFTIFIGEYVLDKRKKSQVRGKKAHFK